MQNSRKLDCTFDSTNTEIHAKQKLLTQFTNGPLEKKLNIVILHTFLMIRLDQSENTFWDQATFMK